jgi:hypothetical protein
MGPSPQDGRGQPGHLSPSGPRVPDPGLELADKAGLPDGQGVDLQLLLVGQAVAGLGQLVDDYLLIDYILKLLILLIIEIIN